jgi:hypothetical protein
MLNSVRRVIKKTKEKVTQWTFMDEKLKSVTRKNNKKVHWSGGRWDDGGKKNNEERKKCQPWTPSGDCIPFHHGPSGWFNPLLRGS